MPDDYDFSTAGKLNVMQAKIGQNTIKIINSELMQFGKSNNSKIGSA